MTRLLYDCKLDGMNGLLDTYNKKKELTPKQESFLGHLVETKGDAKRAAELAGYSGNHYQVLKALKNEVLEVTTNVLAQSAPQAAFKIIEMISSDETIPQANVKLQAAQTLLDRVGVSKSEKLDVNHKVSGGIFIMPEKETIVIDAQDAEFKDAD